MCPASKRKRRYDKCAFGTFYTLTICHSLRLICKRYLTGLPPLLHLLDSLSMFEKLRSCTNPLPGHRIYHRRSCSMVHHLTSLPPLNTLRAPSQTVHSHNTTTVHSVQQYINRKHSHFTPRTQLEYVVTVPQFTATIRSHCN